MCDFSLGKIFCLSILNSSETEKFPVLEEVEKPSAFDPRGQSDVDPRKLFYFDPSKVLTGGVIFILPCLLLGFHLTDAFTKEFDAV